MSLEKFKGKTALITGASSGLGAEFARQLAGAGCNLVLVARRADRMQALKQDILKTHAVRIDILAKDLLEENAAQDLYAELKNSSSKIDVLVNNAGLGNFGEFLDQDITSNLNMMQLDMNVLTELTYYFGRDMKAAGAGYILNVSSIAGFQPSPTYAAYAACKSFVLWLSEALHFELRGTGVHCTALCPGVTRTEFLDVAGQKETLYQKLFMMSAPDCVRIGLQALAKNKASVIPGLANNILNFSNRFVPRSFVRFTVWMLMKNN